MIATVVIVVTIIEVAVGLTGHRAMLLLLLCYSTIAPPPLLLPPPPPPTTSATSTTTTTTASVAATTAITNTSYPCYCGCCYSYCCSAPWAAGRRGIHGLKDSTLAISSSINLSPESLSGQI